MKHTVSTFVLSVLLVLPVFGQEQAQTVSNQLQSSVTDKWQVNFKDSDIHEVVKFVADITGKTMVVDPKLKGRVKVINAEPLSKDELYSLFLSVLELQGFTAIEIDGVVRIVHRKNARTSAIPTRKTGNLSSDAYVTQVIQLYNVSAAKILPVLRPQAPQHAHLAAYSPSNAIIVSDTVANIARLKEIIRQLDRAGVAETDIISLQYAQATEMVKMLQTLLKTDDKNAPQNSKTVVAADPRSNSILVTGDDVRRKKVKSLINRLDVPRQQSGNVRVVYLEYADAEEVAKVLSKVVSNISKIDSNKTGGKSTSGAATATVEADPSTNSLLITADAAALETLLPVIDRLDIRRAQVLVEAIIVEVAGQLARELGVEWAAFKEDRVVSGSLNSTGVLGNLAGNLAAGTSNYAFPAAGLLLGGGQDNRGSGTSFAALLKALQTNSEANVLSTPSLLTTDNNEASISIGDNIPFVTGSFTNSGGDSTDPFQTIERRDVGINLSVTPQISEGDTVVLEIDQEVSSVNPRTVPGAVDLVTSERKITTQVIAKDGETIILGGLLEDDVDQVKEKVPLFGDIPVVGNMFKYQKTEVSKRNLMVFLKASIIRDEETLRGATAEKYNYVRKEQLDQRKKGAALMRDDVLPLLPVWDEITPN